MRNIEDMPNEELYEFVQNYIADKIAKDPQMVRYTYYELTVRLNLSEKGLDRFLRCSRIILEELDYKVYLTGERFRYKNANRIVEINEHMIAIKEDEEDFC